jgi:hypothetical protein
MAPYEHDVTIAASAFMMAAMRAPARAIQLVDVDEEILRFAHRVDDLGRHHRVAVARQRFEGADDGTDTEHPRVDVVGVGRFRDFGRRGAGHAFEAEGRGDGRQRAEAEEFTASPGGHARLLSRRAEALRHILLRQCGCDPALGRLFEGVGQLDQFRLAARRPGEPDAKRRRLGGEA